MIVDSKLIEKYAETNTSPKMPIEKKYVESFLKAMFSSPKIEQELSSIRDNMWNQNNKSVLLLSYNPKCIEFMDEPFCSIIRYSMIKHDPELFYMIQYAFWKFSCNFSIYLNKNRLEDEVRYTDLEPPSDLETYARYEEYDGKMWYCTDTLKLDTDLATINPNLDIPSFYVKDISSNEYEQWNNYFVKEEDFEIMYEKYCRLLSIVKPARYSILKLPVPLGALMYNPNTPNYPAVYGLNNDDYNTWCDIGFNVQFNSLPTIQTVFVRSFYEYNGELYFAYGDDGDTPTTTARGIYKVMESGTSERISNIKARRFCEFQDVIYISCDDKLYKTADFVTFTAIDSITSPNVMCVYNNKLYVNTSSGLYVSNNGETFTLNQNLPVLTMHDMFAFNDKLFIGADQVTSGGAVIKYPLYISDDGETFTGYNMLPGTTNSGLTKVYSFTKFLNKLFVGGYSQYSSYSGLFSTEDGEYFTRELNNNTPCHQIVALCNFNNVLYIMERSSNICYIYYTIDGINKLDTYGELVTDRYCCFGVANNKLYVGPLNGLICYTEGPSRNITLYPFNKLYNHNCTIDWVRQNACLYCTLNDSDERIELLSRDVNYKLIHVSDETWNACAEIRVFIKTTHTEDIHKVCLLGDESISSLAGEQNAFIIEDNEESLGTVVGDYRYLAFMVLTHIKK